MTMKFTLHISLLTKALLHTLYCLLILIIALLSSACSTVKYVPEDKTLLSKVSLVTNRTAINPKHYRQYVRQEPNVKWLGVARVPLSLYNASGRDSTWMNRVLRRLGEAPSIYDSIRTQQSADYIRLALRNKGYLSAEVTYDTTTIKRRTQVVYHLQPGYIYTVRRWRIECSDSTMATYIDSAKGQSLLVEGMPLSSTTLDAERSRLVTYLRHKGYYYYHKDLISFVADSAHHEKGVDLTMRLLMGKDSLRTQRRYRIGEVRVFINVLNTDADIDSLYYRNRIYYFKRGTSLPLSYELLHRSIHIDPGYYYDERRTINSYRSLGALPIVKSSVLRFVDMSDSTSLRADVSLQLNKPHAITAQVEGTNTAGDLGVAASLAYTHKNLFRGGEVFNFKVRGAYEAIGSIEGYDAGDYLEFNSEASLKFPTLLLPFFNREHRHVVSTSEITASYSLQNRPEFRRRVTTGAWRYAWTRHGSRMHHVYDLVSLNYVSMPWVSDTFHRLYLAQANNYNSLMRYSYNDLFIMSSAYSFTLQARTNTEANGNFYRNNGYQIKGKIETAGNLLQAYAQLFRVKRDTLGQREVFGVVYSQYVKLDADFVKHWSINERNSLVLHLGAGIAIPYGNSKVVPYEKRYFAGGANSVRGWSARELGPGSYRPTDGLVNYITQTGNIKLDFNLEYRTNFWGKLHGAMFVDAGNVWTIRDYHDQVGGLFKPLTFYKQIAVSYGLGLRFDLGYFVLRFDGAMKAINPSGQTQQQRYPLISPNFRRDFTLHFAVGYPF